METWHLANINGFTFTATKWGENITIQLHRKETEARILNYLFCIAQEIYASTRIDYRCPKSIYILNHNILHLANIGMCHHPYFTHGETKAQTFIVACPSSRYRSELALESSSPNSQPRGVGMQLPSIPVCHFDTYTISQILLNHLNPCTLLFLIRKMCKGRNRLPYMFIPV